MTNALYEAIDKKLQECVRKGEGHIEIFIFTTEGELKFRIRGGNTITGSFKEIEED